MIILDHILIGSIIGLSFEPCDGYTLAATVGGSLLPDIDLATVALEPLDIWISTGPIPTRYGWALHFLFYYPLSYTGGLSF